MFWKKNRFFHLRSIYSRLVLGYVSLFLVSIIIIFSYLYTHLNYWLIQNSKNYVRAELSAVNKLIFEKPFDKNSLNDFLSKRFFSHRGPNSIRYALFDNQGYLIAKSEGFVEDQASIKEFEVNSERNLYEKIRKSDEGYKKYIITQQMKDSAGTIYYLQLENDPYNIKEIMRKLLVIFAFGIPLIILTTVLSGYFLTRRLLSPITDMIQSVKKISLTGTDPVLLPVRNTGDEFDMLANTFNEIFKKLRESYQRIIIFTANASHELRLPITAIKGSAEIVLERERDTTQYRKTLEDIVEEIDRLSQMLGQLLVLTRADSNADRPVFGDVNIVELINSLKDFYLVLAESRNIAVNLEAQHESIMISADSQKLQQVFSNLLENAIKYTPENGKIEITIIAENEECIVNIKDTGIGIPKDEQEKIFDRFYRIDKSRSREYGGAGLGLSIVDIIVKEHNGKILLDSELNKGSCFTVILPRVH